MYAVKNLKNKNKKSTCYPSFLTFMIHLSGIRDLHLLLPHILPPCRPHLLSSKQRRLHNFYNNKTTSLLCFLILAFLTVLKSFLHDFYSNTTLVHHKQILIFFFTFIWSLSDPINNICYI